MTIREKYFGPRGPDLRRVLPHIRKTFEVQNMWDIHHEISRLAVLGMKRNEIAEKLNVSSAMVGYTLNSKVVEDKVEIMRGIRDAETIDLAKRISDFAPKCLDILEEVIKGDHDDAGIGLRVKAAQDYADRAGLGAVKKHQVLSAHLTREELEEIKSRARESGILHEGEVTDVQAA